MARLWSCGFELQSAAAGVEFSEVSGTPTISTTVKRSGAASMRFNPTDTVQYISHQFASTSFAGHVYFRMYLYVATMPTVDTIIMASCDNIGTGAGRSPRLFLKTNGQLQTSTGSGTTHTYVGGSSATLSTGQWYRVELDFDSAANVQHAYLDGVDFSGAVAGVSFAGFENGTIRVGAFTDATTGGSTTCDLYIDDVAVNDSSGTAQNGLPGAGSIVHLRPAAAGDSNGWATAVGGTSGAANNWTRVSEVTPDDATSYNQTATASVTDDFKVGASLAAGIPAGSTINLVQVGMRAGSTATTSGPTATLRIKGQASGTVSSSAAIAINVNGWVTNAAAAPRVYPLTAYTNPQNGAAWTTATLDTAQIGYSSGTGTTTRRVSTLWALVDYVPAEGGGTDPPTDYTTVTGPASGGTTATGTQTSHMVTVPGAVAGETIVLLVASGNAPVTAVSSSPSLSWTQNASQVWYSYLYAYSAPVTASGTVTITVTTGAGSNATSQAYRVTGITGKDASVTGNGSSGTPSLTTAATAQANEIVFGAYSVFAGAGTDTLTPASGYTGSSSNNTPTTGQTVTLNTLWKALGTTGAQTPSGTLAYSTTWDGLAVTYKTSTPPPPSSGQTVTATPTETTALSDGTSATRALVRGPADGTALGDTAAPARQLARGPADTALLGDQAAGAGTRARAADDNGTLTDIATSTAGMGRTTGEVGALADGAAATASRGRGPVDTGLLTDTATAARAKPTADGANLGDQATPTRGRSHASGDTASLADAHATGRATSLLDTGALKDSPSAVRTALRAPADPAVLSDTAVGARASGRSDTTAVTDAATARRGTGPADTTALTDTAAAARVRPATAGDAAALADTAARTAARARTITDGTALTDTATASRYTVSHEKPADPAALGDTAATTAGRARTGADTTALVDAARSARATTAADTAMLVDMAAKAQARTATAADGITLADTSTTTGSRVRPVADTAAVTDDVSSSQSTRETFHTRDPASLADTSIATAGRVRTAADTTAATDTTAAGRGLPGTDGASLGDQAATVYGHVATPADTTALADTATTAQTRREVLTDPVQLQDSGSATRKGARPHGDTGTLTDGVAGEAQRKRTPGDGGTLADQASGTRSSRTADTSLLVDDASLTIARGQGAADGAVFADAVTAVYQRAVTVADPAGLVDEGRRALTAIRTAADVLGAGDTATAVPVHGFKDLVHLTSAVGTLATRARPVFNWAALTDRVVAHRRGPLDIALTAVPLPARWDTVLLPSGWDLPEQAWGWETQLEDG
ncbi:hypothetical protein ACWEQ7_04385 [Streptomyces sp. NPDC004069]